MMPRSPYKNVTDRSPVNSINTPDTREVAPLKCFRSIAGSDFQHLILCKLRAAVSCALLKSALSQSVVDVVGLRPKEKVLGSYARRVVAVVQNEQPFRYGLAFVQFVRKAVSPHALELTVTLVISRGSPSPARRQPLTDWLRLFTNFCPEPIFTWYGNSSHDLNLSDRLGLWSGSLTAETVGGPFVF